jgi:hypothetical protein
MAFILPPNGRSQSLNSGDWLSKLIDLPCDWSLLPLNGRKTPVDPQTGFPMEGWNLGPGFTSDEIQDMEPLAVGVLLGQASGGLLAVDFDGPGSEEKFVELYGRPSSDLPLTLSWSSGRKERRQLAYRVDREWWPELHGGKRWDNESGSTVLELRWDGQQSAFAGAHPDTDGYSWINGRSPAEFPEPAIAPDWLLEPIRHRETCLEPFTPKPGDSLRALNMLKVIDPLEYTAYMPWLRVGMALHSVDQKLLSAWVDWSRRMPNFNEKECLAKWKSFGRSISIITIRSLHHWAKQNGYTEQYKSRRESSPNFHQIKRAGGGGADVGKITWRIEGFAATGLVLVAAETGTGKTTLLYHAAEAIEEGGLFLDAVPTLKGHVLVVQGDEPEAVAVRKIGRMGLQGNFAILYAQSSIDLDQLIEIVQNKSYTTIIIDSLTTVLVSSNCTTLDQAMVDKLYRLNKVASDNGVLILMTAHLNKPAKDGNGARRKRTQINWADISGISTLTAAVNDCWGLAQVGEHFSLHCLGKRHVEAGAEWILKREAEDYWWGLEAVTNGLKPLEMLDAKQRILALFSGGCRKTAKEVAKMIDLNEEHARRCLCDLFDCGLLRREPVHNSGRGRPSLTYRLNN